MKSTPVFLLGAGKIGRMIATLLTESGDYRVTIADRDAGTLESLAAAGFATLRLNAEDADELRAAVSGMPVVVNAGPHHVTARVARAAREAGAHYFDMTEDVECSRLIKALAADADSVLMPQCGLAPGFVSIVGHELTRSFDTLRSLHMRVGALPQFPTNGLKYNLTWSTDGLINEYCNPCEAIVDGVRKEVAPLESYETFSLDGLDYEAFNTSGGLGTLGETLEGRVQDLDYKTVRYPGHRDVMRLLLEDLRLKHRRAVLKDVLETAVPMTLQDVVLIFVTASGLRDGRLTQESYASKIYGGVLAGRTWSAIQLTTASALCTAVDLVCSGKLPSRGFLRQEQISLDDFLANRFGQRYARGQNLSQTP